MRATTIKGMSAQLRRTLKTRANAHGRSLNKEILACLETSVRSSVVDVERLLKSASGVRRSIKVRFTERELVALKRVGRA